MDEVELELSRKHRAPDFGLFATVPEEKARTTDPITSHRAAQKVALKSGSAKVQLLGAHYHHPSGLIDYEAAQLAGINLRSEYATRCSELAKAGLLENTDQMRLDPESGMPRMVRKITALGKSEIERLDPVRVAPQPARLGRAEV